MYDKETLKEEYRAIYKDWTEEKLDEYATWMANKYATVKFGVNIIHLEYYGGLIDDTDIIEIENTISKVGLELSRFDKNGVPYNSLQDFTLQVSILLSAKIVQDMLLGVGTNALWDGIKSSSLLVWHRIKSKHWDLPKKPGEAKINFGLKVRIDDNTVMDLKLDGEVSENTTLEALDKIIDLIKSTKPNEYPRRERLYIYDNPKKNWKEVDVMKELDKRHKKRSKGKKGR